jgi:hypothetical protein
VAHCSFDAIPVGNRGRRHSAPLEVSAPIRYPERVDCTPRALLRSARAR